jgi:GNAT superfamily N-acetyltransferase
VNAQDYYHWMIIRPAEQGDAEALARLNRDFNGVTRDAEDVRSCLGSTSGEFILVATADADLLGFACTLVSRSFCYPEPSAEVTELFVSPSARRQGVGGNLLLACVDLARTFGAKAVHVRTNSRNAAMQALLSGAGFAQADNLVFKRTLTSGSAG